MQEEETEKGGGKFKAPLPRCELWSFHDGKGSPVLLLVTYDGLSHPHPHF